MISTGIRGLDEVITGLRAGDNVVWQIDDIKDYATLVKPFVRSALKDGRKVVYMRFASHRELLKPSKEIRRYELDAYAGFESFTTNVNTIITREGEGAYYVFDCLSELLFAWATDFMIGNFFMVTCPYLYELKTVTYFSILRNNHSFKSIACIRETTQLLMDVYRCEGSMAIHPLKVWNRYSPTMFLPHQHRNGRFVPIVDSVNAVKILSYIQEKGGKGAKRNLDHWDRLFLEAEDLLRSDAPKKKVADATRRLCGVMITGNRALLSLAIDHLSLGDLIEIKSRLIGTGFIGGKTAGMLLARKILSKRLGDWQALSEPHDSFFVGSDIFYSYIVQNRLWKLRLQQKTDEGYYGVAKILKEKMLYGTFSEEIMEHFQQIIEYFGSSPIIIRSSSLLEDSFGNAFAGKYESIFLANQGTPEQRYIQFAEAVKRIYASTMNEDALAYRKQRGLDKMDEQMALLVQRVSGAHHKDYFFPDLAGVGVSYNTYVWSAQMDPKAGMVRLVFGLGTRAVNRVEGDYPRMVALDEPLRTPYAEKRDVRKFSQHEADLINTRKNTFQTVPVETILDDGSYANRDRLASRDDEGERMMAERGREAKEQWVLTFDHILTETALVDTLKSILVALEGAYRYPIEIEFTVNFVKGGAFRINLLQCRPLQTRGMGPAVAFPRRVRKEDLFFESQGSFLGGNISQEIRRVIAIDPQGYCALGESDKYEVARAVGALNAAIGTRDALPTLLMGPGRWGSTTASLGIPVKFAEINHIAALAEIAFVEGNLMPELSFGTHFFQDLVETNIFYVALFPDAGRTRFKHEWFKREKNLFAELLPQSSRLEDVIGVFDVSGRKLRIRSDVVSQKVICFSNRSKASR